MLESQEYLFNLLLEIDDICKRHGIDYILAYGTLLGAVRHEGFIPWDNDLDIIMDWDNYQKFRSACDEELDGVTRSLQDNRYNREFSLCCGHYTDLTTCRMSSRTVFWEPLCGQYIDVFIAAEMPGPVDEMRERYNLYCAYDEYSNRVYNHQMGKPADIYELYQQMNRRAREVGREATLQEVEAQIFGHEYDDCEYCFTTTARLGSFIAFVPKDALHDVIDVTFEGHTFKAPRDWARALTLWYGDGFNIIPSVGRVHSEMSYSGLPAACYVDDYMDFLDKDEIIRTLDEFKEAGVDKGARLAEDFHEVSRLQSLMLSRKMMGEIRRLEERTGRAVELDGLDAELMDMLFPIVQEYVKKQLSYEGRHFHEHFETPLELEEIIWHVMAFGRFNFLAIDQFAAIRWFNRLEFTDAMKEVLGDCSRFRAVRKGLLYGRGADVQDDLAYLEQKYPWMPQVQTYGVRMRMQQADGPEQLQDCLVRAEEVLAGAPEFESCKKARADILWELGREEDARLVYEELKASSSDGLILLDISKRERENTHGGQR